MEIERKNVTQPADWWAAFRKQAKREKMTLSQWLGECAKDRLPKATAAKLSDRPPAHRVAKAGKK